MKFRTHLFLLLAVLFLLLISCGDDDDMTLPVQQENPIDVPIGDINDPDEIPLMGDPNEIIGKIQDRFRFTFELSNSRLMPFVRQNNLFSIYSSSARLGDELWRQSYILLEETILLGLLNEQEGTNISYHLGVAQVLQSYAFLNLVDLFGDVPYTDVFNVGANGSPAIDSASSVYDAHLSLLETAIQNLSAEVSDIPIDKYYGDFDRNKWIALANTIKLRAYTNLRLVNSNVAREQINSLLNANIIDSPEEDFVFDYSLNPEVFENHPLFSNGSTANSYMSNNLFDYMNVGDATPPFIETGVIDPRARYYFYRQRDSAPSGSNLPCSGNPEYEYCYVGNLYWGRDHGDDEGIPNDGFRRTFYGVYPVGGEFDNDAFLRFRDNSNDLDGKGITPFLLSSYTNFLLAENALTLGTNGSDIAYLESGIRQSMQKVRESAENLITLDANTSSIDLAMTNVQIDDYVTRVLNEYNGSTADVKLEIIEREYYIAAFGNGFETYNAYRRTGKPELQAPFIPSQDFPRSFYYPEEAVLYNVNIEQHPLTQQVFWDTNPAGFID